MMTLLQFLIVLLQLHNNHVDTLSLHAQFPQIVPSSKDNQSLSQNNGIECPSVWFKYNQTTQDCQCIALTSLTCDGERAYTGIHHVLTYNANRGVISVIKMRHQYLRGYNTTDGEFNILLPNDISKLNHYMCGPLNRKQYMCKECIMAMGQQ